MYEDQPTLVALLFLLQQHFLKKSILNAKKNQLFSQQHEERIERARVNSSKNEERIGRTHLNSLKNEERIGRTRVNSCKNEERIGRTHLSSSKNEERIGRTHLSSDKNDERIGSPRTVSLNSFVITQRISCDYLLFFFASLSFFSSASSHITSMLLFSMLGMR